MTWFIQYMETLKPLYAYSMFSKPRFDILLGAFGRPRYSRLSPGLSPGLSTKLSTKLSTRSSLKPRPSPTRRFGLWSIGSIASFDGSWRIILLCTLFVTACSGNTRATQETFREINTLSDLAQNTMDVSQNQTDILNVLVEQNEVLKEELVSLDTKLNVLYQMLGRGVPESSLPRTLNSDTPSIEIQRKASSSKLVLGRYEWLNLSRVNFPLSASLSTATEYSRIYTTRSTPFERDEKKWLRFILQNKENQITLEAPVVRTEKITLPGESASVRARVVELNMSLASFNDNIEFLIIEQRKRIHADKKNTAIKKKPSKVILGKNFLTDVALVDVALKYTQEKPKIE